MDMLPLTSCGTLSRELYSLKLFSHRQRSSCKGQMRGSIYAKSLAQLAHSKDLVSVSFYHIDDVTKQTLNWVTHIPGCTQTTLHKDRIGTWIVLRGSVYLS